METKEKTETMDDTRKKLKEIYSFTVEKTEKVKQTKTKKVKNPETQELEEVSVTKEVSEDIPYRVILKMPTRRDIEEAELEYSIEMSNCIRKGILTKAMLAKKYSDTGGLLTEEDAKSLTANYVKYGEVLNEYQKLSIKKKKATQDEDKISKLAGKLSTLRKEIVDVETSYSSLFNHTADTRAQNRTIQWYILHLTHIQKADEDEINPLFEGESFEDKLDSYYRLEEEGDELYDISGGKVTTLMSFWYYSSGSVSKEDFEKFEDDLDSGKI
jgi:hypothetical protein